jgi:two-component system, NarL family, nitrate/nitrite response regulator NarL
MCRRRPDRQLTTVPSVAIVEDHRLLAEVLRSQLAAHRIDADIVTADSSAALLTQLLDLRPDLVLLDLDLGAAGAGERLVGPLHAAGSRVVVVSGTDDMARVADALDEGAFGYCPKTVPFETLIEKVRAALHAERPLDEVLHRQLRAELARREAERRARWEPFERLTDRERHTLIALSRGKSVRDIARSWVVSEATVRTHVRAVLAKLDAPSQLAAVAAALSTGWLAAAS